ncbi:MAG TPA: hypothetical protein VF682_20850 [Pseudomonas sp.]|jgi:hypothetical protein
MAQNDEGAGRFWEFYALRYSVGAVLGALIIFLLVKQTPQLSDLIFIKKGESIDMIQVGVFLGIGLFYSYLASAPILVFHVGRFLIPRADDSFFNDSGWVWAIYLFASLLLPVLFAVFSPLDSGIRAWFSVIIFLASAVFFGQLLIIKKCHSQRKKLFLFYKNLSTNRAYATGGIVDSYRHLREHGNAFGIIFFEMMLAVFLFAASHGILAKRLEPFEVAATFGAVILAWIMPATLVWLIGCIVEQEFVDS